MRPARWRSAPCTSRTASPGGSTRSWTRCWPALAGGAAGRRSSSATRIPGAAGSTRRCPPSTRARRAGSTPSAAAAGWTRSGISAPTRARTRGTPRTAGTASGSTRPSSTRRCWGGSGRPPTPGAERPAAGGRARSTTPPPSSSPSPTSEGEAAGAVAVRRGPVLRSPGMRIEIICTGDEVLTGKIVNTNFGYMSQKLEDVGLSVQWGTTVGDDRETLLQAFRLAGERAEAVTVNGGRGPTGDDLSQEIAAQAAGVELVFSEEWYGRMAELFRRRSRVMPPSNRKQAMLPVGAELLDNPIGTACGFALDIGRACFFFTPGVPRELHRMLEEQVIPRLLAKSGLQ